ncbi:MAG: GNAT family N-acetyltransferase [Deltaproteobacteria bacterium]|nr:GNAT family N-acetyltransferase [Deltaproteobacteria bacterium]
MQKIKHAEGFRFPDEYDFRADTRQIVALKDGQAIGRVRILYNNLPIEKDFEIPNEFAKGNTKTEVSKFMIEKSNRGTGSYLGLLRFIYHHVRDCGDVYISNLPKLEKFYERMGFRKMGNFENTELDDNYSAMHIYIPHFTFNPEKLRQPKFSSLLRKLIMVPIPKNEIEDFYLQEKSNAIAIAHKTGAFGEY